MKHFFSNLYASSAGIIFTTWLMACANVIPPSGGPEDLKEPQVKQMIPKSGATNFKGGKVIIEFNEEIEIDNNPTNVIVSPIMKDKIEIKDKKKYLELNIPSTLDSNTTYNINLNNLVKDITKGNIVKNITFAFSTGKKIDSLSLKGKTIDIESKSGLKEILVGLYQKTDTLNIFNHRPLYITYSKTDGSFNLQYLKEGIYYLAAIEDKNKNLLLNNQEKVMFMEEVIINGEEQKTLNLELSISDTSGNKIVSKKPLQNKHLITYKNGIKKYTYKPLKETDVFYVIQDKNKAKELTVYPQTYQNDSLQYILSTIDSLGNNTKDTLTLYLKTKQTKKEKANLTTKTNDILPGTKELIFISNKPISKIEKDSIEFNTNTAFEIELNRDRDSLKIKWTGDTKDSTKITLKKGSVILYDEDTLEQKKFTFLKADPANYSALEVKIKTEEQNYIIQLLTENYTVIEEYKNITILNYNYIKPGSYRIRAIVDKNVNGYWDSINMKTNEKAEPIYYFNNDKINLKPNWELKDLMFIF